MSSTPVIRGPDEVDTSWLGCVLKQGVESFTIASGHGNWSRQLAISARMADGSTRALRLKICLGHDFGRSEVDFYTRDYVDLAYFMMPWWPEHARQASEVAVLRRWYDALDKPGYAWSEALADWRLSVEQCLHVPMEWCSKEATRESMRWLWQEQFARIQHALARTAALEP